MYNSDRFVSSFDARFNSPITSVANPAQQFGHASEIFRVYDFTNNQFLNKLILIVANALEFGIAELNFQAGFGICKNFVL